MNTEIKNNMQVITPTEGHVMTDWDGNDILNFSYCRIIYAPLSVSIDGYRESEEIEAEMLAKQMMETVEKMEKEREKERERETNME